MTPIRMCRASVPGLAAALGLAALLAGYARAAETVLGTPDAQLCFEAAKQPAEATYADVHVCTRALESADLNARDRAATYSNRGVLQSARGRHQQALEDHEAALALQPGLLRARLNRANTLSRLKRYEEALEAYDEVLEFTDGTSHLTYFNRAMLHLDREDRLAARTDLLRALELAPDQRLYRNVLAELQ